MIQTELFSADKRPTRKEKDEVIDFLFDNLQQYGDPKNQIERAIDYSTKEFTSFGGFTMVMKEDDKIRAAVVINRTGMDGYIPENILVYKGRTKARIIISTCSSYEKAPRKRNWKRAYTTHN